MRIGFTGTREGMTENQKKALEKLLIEFLGKGASEFHHGDCVGADKEAHEIASALGYKVVVHPPRRAILRAFCAGDVILPERDYLQRNRDVVDSTDILIAAPKSGTEVLRSGTWSTVRYARRKGKQIIILEPILNEKILCY